MLISRRMHVQVVSVDTYGSEGENRVEGKGCLLGSYNCSYKDFYADAVERDEVEEGAGFLDSRE